MFSIRSMHSSRELIFTPCERRHCYLVELKDFEISLSLAVYHNPGISDLSVYLRALAKYTHPWQGSEEWWSEDEDFKISAQCTSRGYVLLRVTLGSKFIDFDNPEKWEVNIGLETTLGELDTIAENATRFFRQEVLND